MFTYDSMFEEPASDAEVARAAVGLLGAAIGIALLFASQPATFLQIVCAEQACLGGDVEPYTVYEDVVLRQSHLRLLQPQPLSWMPWVDDRRCIADCLPAPADLDDESLKSQASACTGRIEASTLPLLVEAPLPPEYRPFAQPTDLYACIRVAGDVVLGARLLGSSGSPATDRRFLAAIRSDWRFRGITDQPQWVRVRLDNGPRPELRLPQPTYGPL